MYGFAENADVGRIQQKCAADADNLVPHLVRKVLPVCVKVPAVQDPFGNLFEVPFLYDEKPSGSQPVCELLFYVEWFCVDVRLEFIAEYFECFL